VADERKAPGTAADERKGPGTAADERKGPGTAADERNEPGTAAVLRVRPFALLWLGQLISLLGDMSQMVGISVFIYTMTGSNLALGGVVALQAVPAMLFGPLGGIAVDLLDKRKLMVACDLARMALVGALVLFPSVPYAYAVSFLVASIGVIFNTTRTASIPLLVGGDLMMSANSFVALSGSFIRIVGPPVGGVLIALWSVSAAFLVNSASYAISAAMILLISFPVGRAAGPKRSSFWSSLTQGFREIWRNPELARLTWLFLLAMVAVGGVQVLYPGYVFGTLKAGSAALGLIQSSQGAGALVGALIVTALARRLPYGRSISAGLAGLGLGVITLGLVPSVPTACAGMFVAGMALTAANIGANTAIMKLVPLEILGRVGGTLESLITSASLMAMLAAGLLADSLGVVSLLRIAGAVLVVAAGYGFWAFRGAVGVGERGQRGAAAK